MDSRFSQSGFVTGSCLFVMEARKPSCSSHLLLLRWKVPAVRLQIHKATFDAALYGSASAYHTAVSTANKHPPAELVVFPMRA